MRIYEEEGEKYLEDTINGCDWHIPDRSEPIVGENGEWIEE